MKNINSTYHIPVYLIIIFIFRFTETSNEFFIFHAFGYFLNKIIVSNLLVIRKLEYYKHPCFFSLKNCIILTFVLTKMD